MNGRTAKKIRKMVYGDAVTNIKGRKYHYEDRQCFADPIRQMYQKIKKDYTRKAEYAEDKKQAEGKNQSGN